MNANDLKNWFLAIGIGIIYVLFVNYGVETFYPSPQYDDYCDYRTEPLRVAAPESCGNYSADAALQKECNEKKGYLEYEYDAQGCALEGTASCNTCNQEYNDYRDQYNTNLFFTMIVLGVLVLIGGLFVKVTSVSAGMLLGGILTIIVGTLRSWSDIGEIVRFILLGVVLAILVYIGYKKTR